ncbi:MAG: hypothetical protein WAV76_12690 [Bacteroidota bacterium]
MKIWILCHVYRGIIQDPEIFMDKSKALERKKKIELSLNKDYDELILFPKTILSGE